MRKYEMTLILDPNLTVVKKKELIAKIKKILEGGKGKVEKSDEWGKKSLAYPIKKMKEGDYLFWEVSLPEKSPIEIDKKLRLENEILRCLLVRQG